MIIKKLKGKKKKMKINLQKPTWVKQGKKCYYKKFKNQNNNYKNVKDF